MGKKLRVSAGEPLYQPPTSQETHQGLSPSLWGQRCAIPSTAPPPRLPPHPTCRAEAEAFVSPTLTHPVWRGLTSPTLCVTDHCLVSASDVQPLKGDGLFVAGFSYFLLVLFRVLSFYAFTKIFPKTHTLTLCFYSLFLPDNTHKAVKRGLSTSSSTIYNDCLCFCPYLFPRFQQKKLPFQSA